MLYMDCIAEAVWKTLRSTVSSGWVEAGPPVSAKEERPAEASRSLEINACGSLAMPCWGGVGSECWKASPWSSWVAGVGAAEISDPTLDDDEAVAEDGAPRGRAGRVGCFRLAKRSSCWPLRKRSCIQRKR